MPKLRILRCPVHRDVILFKIAPPDPTAMHMIVPPPPKECPKCRKSYYEHECVEK